MIVLIISCGWIIYESVRFFGIDIDRLCNLMMDNRFQTDCQAVGYLGKGEPLQTFHAKKTVSALK